MNETDNNPEQSREAQVRAAISQAHETFFEKVPQYSKGAWNPRQALRYGSGSCMAELLFVAGSLMSKGLVQEDQLTVGFSASHGEDQPVGFVGKSGKKYAHTVLFITQNNGRTLECGFRENRADEAPIIEVLQGQIREPDSFYVGTLPEAIKAYAAVEQDSTPPSVKELISLHNPDQTIDTSDVRFDQDF